MGERVVPRRRAGVAQRRRRTALLVAIPILVVALVASATFTPLFGARDVIVTGTTTLSPGEVTDLAGIGVGTNVVHFDAAAAERAIEADPWVASATVSRDLPTTITVQVVERVPVARVGREVLAADGTVLPGADGTGLPWIATSLGEPSPGQRAGATAALGALAPVVRSRVETVVVEPDDDLLLMLDDGVTVTYGAAEQHAAKAQALRALVRWVTGEGVAVEALDVSVPSAPTAMPVGGSITPVP